MMVNGLSGSSVPNAISSREQELTQQLSERLADRLSRIRQRITPQAESTSETGVGRVLDVRV